MALSKKTTIINFVDDQGHVRDVKRLKLGETITWCKPFSLTISQGTGTTLTVTRTSAEEPSAGLTTLSNGSTIYYNDYLDVSAKANTGYTLSNASSSCTVKGDVKISSTAVRKTWNYTLTAGNYATIHYTTSAPNSVSGTISAGKSHDFLDLDYSTTLSWTTSSEGTQGYSYPTTGTNSGTVSYQNNGGSATASFNKVRLTWSYTLDIGNYINSVTYTIKNEQKQEIITKTITADTLISSIDWDDTLSWTTNAYSSNNEWTYSGASNSTGTRTYDNRGGVASITQTRSHTQHYFDLNQYINGISAHPDNPNKFNVYINGSLASENTTDYYAKHPYGTTWKVTAGTFAAPYEVITTLPLSGTITSQAGASVYFKVKSFKLTKSLGEGVNSATIKRVSQNKYQNESLSGTLENGSTIYYDDALSVSGVTAKAYYALDSYKSSYTVTNNTTISVTAHKDVWDYTLTAGNYTTITYSGSKSGTVPANSSVHISGIPANGSISWSSSAENTSGYSYSATGTTSGTVYWKDHGGSAAASYSRTRKTWSMSITAGNYTIITYSGGKSGTVTANNTVNLSGLDYSDTISWSGSADNSAGYSYSRTSGSSSLTGKYSYGDHANVSIGHTRTRLTWGFNFDIGNYVTVYYNIDGGAETSITASKQLTLDYASKLSWRTVVNSDTAEWDYSEATNATGSSSYSSSSHSISIGATRTKKSYILDLNPYVDGTHAYKGNTMRFYVNGVDQGFIADYYQTVEYGTTWKISEAHPATPYELTSTLPLSGTVTGTTSANIDFKTKSSKLVISKGTGVSTVTVNRTSSPNRGATTGNIAAGSTVYYGDVLSISATAAGYYALDSYTTSCTVDTLSGDTLQNEVVSITAHRSIWDYTLSAGNYTTIKYSIAKSGVISGSRKGTITHNKSLRIANIAPDENLIWSSTADNIEGYSYSATGTNSGTRSWDDHGGSATASYSRTRKTWSVTLKAGSYATVTYSGAASGTLSPGQSKTITNIDYSSTISWSSSHENNSDYTYSATGSNSGTARYANNGATYTASYSRTIIPTLQPGTIRASYSSSKFMDVYVDNPAPNGTVEVTMWLDYQPPKPSKTCAGGASCNIWWGTLTDSYYDVHIRFSKSGYKSVEFSERVEMDMPKLTAGTIDATFSSSGFMDVYVDNPRSNGEVTVTMWLDSQSPKPSKSCSGGGSCNIWWGYLSDSYYDVHIRFSKSGYKSVEFSERVTRESGGGGDSTTSFTRALVSESGPFVLYKEEPDDISNNKNKK